MPARQATRITARLDIEVDMVASFDCRVPLRHDRLSGAYPYGRMATLHRTKTEKQMARRNQGPKLRWFADRGAYYITWTVNGRSRKCSTDTADREQAEAKFGEWLQVRKRRHGPSDPAEVLVTDILTDYAAERGPKVMGQDTMGRAIETLTRFWEGRTGEAPLAVDAYVTQRDRAAGTRRRELGVLQTAINHAYKHGRLARPVAIELPASPPARKTWLTRIPVRLGSCRPASICGPLQASWRCQ